MHANQLTIGGRYTCQVGRHEIAVRLAAADANGWQVETAAGRRMSVRDAARFHACLDTPAVAAPAPAAAPRVSLLTLAVEIMRTRGAPLGTGEIVREAMTSGRWAPRQGGKTPERTLYSAILREIATKGNAARFRKTARGKFAVAQ